MLLSYVCWAFIFTYNEVPPCIEFRTCQNILLKNWFLAYSDEPQYLTKESWPFSYSVRNWNLGFIYSLGISPKCTPLVKRIKALILIENYEFFNFCFSSTSMFFSRMDVLGPKIQHHPTSQYVICL